MKKVISFDDNDDDGSGDSGSDQVIVWFVFLNRCSGRPFQRTESCCQIFKGQRQGCTKVSHRGFSYDVRCFIIFIPDIKPA